jgi:hypothetical protein
MFKHAASPAMRPLPRFVPACSRAEHRWSSARRQRMATVVSLNKAQPGVWKAAAGWSVFLQKPMSTTPPLLPEWLHGKKLLIIGWSVSGTAVATLAALHGATVLGALSALVACPEHNAL